MLTTSTALDAISPPKATDRPSTTFHVTAPQTVTVDEAINVPLWLDQSAVANSAKRQKADTLDIGLGYQMCVIRCVLDIPWCCMVLYILPTFSGPTLLLRF